MSSLGGGFVLSVSLGVRWRKHSRGPNQRSTRRPGTHDVTAAETRPSLTLPERARLEPSVRGLADVLAALARGLGDRATRQRAADRALEVANAVSGSDAPTGSTLAVAATGVRLVATDLMVFAGVNLDDAVEAVREGILEQRVAAPARAPRRRLGWLRRRLTR